jgi:ureidoglycolate lyase
LAVIAEPLSSAAFSRFGEVVEHAGRERRRMLPDATTCAKESSAARLWVSLFAEPARLPLTISTLERHRFSPQTFIPLEVSRYLVTVAPSDASGRPILSEVRAFIVGAGRGVVYRRGVWHSGMTVLDRPGRFAVLFWSTGDASTDDEFLELNAPFEVAEA